MSYANRGTGDRAGRPIRAVRRLDAFRSRPRRPTWNDKFPATFPRELAAPGAAGDAPFPQPPSSKVTAVSKVRALDTRGKAAAPLDTPTDLSADAVSEISEQLNAILADDVCALSQDQEFPLACQRAAFPRLPSAARRARRADFRLDRRHRRARAQDRRHDAALDRPDLQAAEHRGQRRRAT